jgi:zinc protease
MRKTIPIILLLTIAAASLAIAAETNQGVRLPQYREVKLPNGATLLLVEKRDVPLIAFTARVRGGAAGDAAGREGTSAVAAELLQKGAGKRSAVEFAAALDSIGANLSVVPGRESIVVRGDFLAKDAPLVIELLSDMLRRPRFEAEEFVKVRDRAIESIAAAKDSDLRTLIPTYFSSYFHGDHPYGRPLRGSETTLASLTRDDVVTWSRSHLGGDRLVLAMVGDFNSKSMEAQLRRAFGDWGRAAAKAPETPKVSPLTGRRVLLVDKPDATQTYFLIGNAGISRRDPDRVAVELANTYFGGRFTSLLNDALRVKSGLTYGARSMLVQESEAGPVAISSYTKTEATAEAVDMALDVLSGFRGRGLDDEALASVKSYVLGQFPPGLETNSQLAGRLADIAFYGLGRNDVDAFAPTVNRLTADEIGKAIERVYPKQEDLTFVFIGQAAAIRDVVAKYGEVEEIRITDPKFRP